MFKISSITFVACLFAIGGCKSLSERSALLKDGPGDRQAIVMTDNEGFLESLQSRINDGTLKFFRDANGKTQIDFGPNAPQGEFLFLGDLGGRGPHALKLLEWFTDFKKRYPSRVRFVPGNHEDGRLSLLRDLANQPDIARDLAMLIKRDGYSNFSEAIGADFKEG